MSALTGCQSSGGSENAAEHASWWDWSTKTPPSSNPNGSPFSTAATYNRQNTSEMGLTVYDGTSHAKPPAPPPTSPSTAPCPGAAPPANPSTVCPPGSPTYVNAGPNLGPGVGGAAPTGYWVYQPAYGYPAINQAGGPQVIPVYGPPMGGVPGNGPMTTNGTPTMPANSARAPAYPVNNPANFPAPAPVNTPFARGALAPPNGTVGVQPVGPPDSGAQTAGSPQPFTSPSYVQGGFPANPATAGGAPMPGSPGVMQSYAPPQSVGVAPTQAPPSFGPSQSVDVPAPATAWPR